MEPQKYIHEEAVHNTDAPQEIVPAVYRLLQPKSVVDVGCGIGTFLYCFKQAGVKKVLGIDGPWADKNLRKKYLADDEFKETDLEKPFNLPEKFDLAVCLEVAEHLTEPSADAFIKNLASLSDVILFSAALPNQGGQNHLNEQTPAYWEKKFNAQGFEFHDLLREPFWNNDKIFWWYRQNIFLVARKGYAINNAALPTAVSNTARMVIHPELFNYTAQVANVSINKLSLLENGGYSIKVYVQLLLRALKRKLGLLGKSLPTLIFDSKYPMQK